MAEIINIFVIEENKTNVALMRRFGLELEFTKRSNREFLYYIITKSCPNDKVLITSWQKNIDNEEWICKTDSSCGYEVATPVFSTRNDLEKLRRVVDSLNENGAKVDKNCGIHVHVECRDLNAHKLLRLVSYWLKSEKIITSMFPDYRKESKFCCPLSDDLPLLAELKSCTPLKIISVFSKKRNRSMNIKHCRTRGTIEFRLMEGNLQSENIVNWTLFCLDFYKSCLEHDKPLNFEFFDLAQFWEFMDFHKESDESIKGIRRWIVRRIEKFSPDMREECEHAKKQLILI